MPKVERRYLNPYELIVTVVESIFILLVLFIPFFQPGDTDTTRL